MAESLDAYDPPTLPNITNSTDAPSISNTAANSSALDDFNNFTMRKRDEGRKSVAKADSGKRHSARTSDNKGKAKANDMDIEN